LKACNTGMSTLHYRRVRGDMIETYKTLYWKYDTCGTTFENNWHPSNPG